jgi:ParB-like chromosome segregation protein Spo0J
VRRGDALPPIAVRKRPEGYYVIDGRHRVSVARATGQRDIDAWVT